MVGKKGLFDFLTSEVSSVNEAGLVKGSGNTLGREKNRMFIFSGIVFGSIKEAAE